MSSSALDAALLTNAKPPPPGRIQKKGAESDAETNKVQGDAAALRNDNAKPGTSTGRGAGRGYHAMARGAGRGQNRGAGGNRGFRGAARGFHRGQPRVSENWKQIQQSFV